MFTLLLISSLATAPAPTPTQNNSTPTRTTSAKAHTSKLKTTPLTAKDLDALSPEVLKTVGKDSVNLKQSFKLTDPGTPHDQSLFLVSNTDNPKPGFLHIFDIRQGAVFQTLDDHPGNEWTMVDVEAVEFQDLNGDGLLDVVVLATPMTGVGPTAAEPFLSVGIWLGTADGKWALDAATSDAVTTEQPNGKLKQIVAAAKKHLESKTESKKP
jgi:hypothetical protein